MDVISMDVKFSQQFFLQSTEEAPLEWHNLLAMGWRTSYAPVPCKVVETPDRAMDGVPQTGMFTTNSPMNWWLNMTFQKEHTVTLVAIMTTLLSLSMTLDIQMILANYTTQVL